MNRITDKSHVPPMLYNYTIKEIDIEYKAHTFGLLVVKVRNALIGNQITFDETTLADVIEADFCQRYPFLCANGPVTADDPPEMAQAQGDAITRMAAAVGIPAADALAKLSKMMGINCAACNQRHRIIRKMRKLGIKETLRQLKETF